MDDERALLDEQIAYYRARAAEYDATSPAGHEPFGDAIGRVRAALTAFEPRGRVLEIAAGTGHWTAQLAAHADELLVTDSSPEMLDLNRSRVGRRAHVTYQVSDAFALQPSHAFDTVFLGFFLSHVPPGRFAAFWGVLGGLLAPGGRVFLVDEADHGLWDEDWIDQTAGIVRRPLNDGTAHRAVKVLWHPEELRKRLETLGWTASVHLQTPFYWATAAR